MSGSTLSNKTQKSTHSTRIPSQPDSSVEVPSPQASPQPGWDTPTLNDAAREFLENINPERDFKYLMFDDQLVTVSDTGKELGEFTVTIEPTRRGGNEIFLIHANSHGSVDGVPCGTSITCYVDKSLRTLEQIHHEYVKLENCPLDRKTTIAQQENNSYVVSRVITQGEDVQRLSKTYTEEQMRGFISEGANLLLHRLMLEKMDFVDNFQMIAFDSELNICPATYRRLEERTQTVDGTELRVYGISRTIQSPTDLPTTWQSYFMADGHLTHRVQIGSPVTMKLDKVPTLIEKDEEPPKPAFDKKPLNWEEDMQLYSDYMDKKEELKGAHFQYLRHHPELKAIMADFLQFLLLRKPDDVIAFAAEYFASFSSAMPSHSPYLASNAPTPFPRSRTNTRIEQLRTPTR